MEFRAIKESDFESCAKSLIETFSEEPWNERWTLQQAFERIDELMASRMSRGFVVIENNEAVGMCVGRIMTYMDFKELWVDEFSINPKVQGQGMGSKLIEYVKTEIAKENVNNMALTTERGYPAVKFYEKNGFKVKDSIIFMHN
ncbi:MAG: GNAT family N-acetyltransferase [Oscillospiraceae bacterium]|nr:GNAT family N-acetyltransferase [Oscillospiraceae bacterium]